MKRSSILATMVATGLLGIAALAPGAASADVLCDSVFFSYNCPAENTYGIGTEFHADNNGNILISGAKDEKQKLASCSDSEFDTTITNAGGAGPHHPNNPEVSIANAAFTDCDLVPVPGLEVPISVLSNGYGVITRYDFSGSMKGRFYWLDEQIEVDLMEYGLGRNCVYSVVGTGTLAGPKTDETSVTKIVFDDTAMQLISGTACYFKTLYLSGRYDLGSQGVYVNFE